MKLAHDLFWSFDQNTKEALRLKDMLQKAKQEADLLKEEILNEPKLHEILTTVGIIHDKKLYKKVVANNMPISKSAEPHYYLDIQDYIEPVNSFQLDAKLGDNNE